MVLTAPFLLYIVGLLIYKEDDKYVIKRDIALPMLVYMVIAEALFIYKKVDLFEQFLLVGITAPMVVSGYIDNLHKEIPNRTTLVSFIFSLIFFGYETYLGNASLTTLLVCFTAWFLMFIMSFCSDGLGFGDVKMLIPVFLTVSAKGSLTTFGLGVIVGFLLLAIFMVITKKKEYQMGYILLYLLLFSLTHWL